MPTEINPDIKLHTTTPKILTKTREIDESLIGTVTPY